MTNVIVAVITAYCACTKCCGSNAVGLTASGKPPVQGVTVAGPRNLPFGTVVYIEGVGRRVVQDRTARRYDGRFDVYFTKHADAVRFGIRTNRVWIAAYEPRHRNTKRAAGGR